MLPATLRRNKRRLPERRHDCAAMKRGITAQPSAVGSVWVDDLLAPPRSVVGVAAGKKRTSLPRFSKGAIGDEAEQVHV